MKTRAFLLAVSLTLIGAAQASDYAVVVSQKANTDAGWHRVVETLRKNHKGEVIVYKTDVNEALSALQKSFPRYACFVATPEEAGRVFVAQVHRLTRRLDDDLYTDCQWGIVTGYNADAAQRTADETKPLLIRKAASGTEIPLENFEEGVWFSELKKNQMARKAPNGKAEAVNGPDDTTEALANTFNTEKVDLFITSGHATERDWQIGYGFRGGQFRCEEGKIFGLNVTKRKIPIDSPNPKVYLPIGNCLMGHINDKDAMALAFMNSGGVRQMIGYTELTWFGYGGWGVLDYFIEQPRRYSFNEAFFANQQALLHRLSLCSPELAVLTDEELKLTAFKPKLSDKAQQIGLTEQDARGLHYDRDCVAFYGDPAWQARLAPAPLGWEQKLTQQKGTFTLEIKPLRGANSFKPLSFNGSQRGGRPFFQMLPQRIGKAIITEGAELKPVITDNFVLVPNPGNAEAGKTYRVTFRASPLK